MIKEIYREAYKMEMIGKITLVEFLVSMMVVYGCLVVCYLIYKYLLRSPGKPEKKKWKE